MPVTTVLSIPSMLVVMVMAVVMLLFTFVSRGGMRGYNYLTVFTVDLRPQTRPEGWLINRLLPTNRGVVMNFERFLLRWCGCGLAIPSFAIVLIQDRV